MEPQPVVKITNLNHSFGEGDLRKQVLFDISLQLNPGEVVMLMGPSGCGKTTLLTLMGGLRSVQEGSVQILGQELHGSQKGKLVRIRRYIGYIFQGHNLLKSLTARQNVQMSLDLHPGLSTKHIVRQTTGMLESVGLKDHVNYYPANLSGGQKQRVAIARALVSHPKLVLADEPTAALDSKTGRSVVEVMQRLATQQGCTILIVTHDPRILDVADRIVQMEDGRLVKDEANQQREAIAISG